MRLSLLGLTAFLVLNSQQICAEEPEQILELEGDYTIAVSINGQPFRMAVDPDIGYSRLLSNASAVKLGLKGSMIGGVHMVGPIRLMANSNVLKYDFGEIKDKNRTFWFRDQSPTWNADGAISASAMPYQMVRFKLRPATGNEKVYSLALSDNGGNAILSGKGGNAILNVNGTEIAVGFNLRRNETLVTASTGLLLSDSFNGSFSGPAISTPIRYGIERPARPILLAQPLDVGGLPLDTMLVRVADFGDASRIAEEDAEDGDEIIVTAQSKRKPRHNMVLGRDFLSRCSTLTFDYRKKQVEMLCAL